MTTRILVVDDSQVDRCLILGLLSNGSDWRVDLAEDGKHALTRIAADRPDLVVTDLVMPEMDGLELMRAIQRRCPDLPVILLTAHGNESLAVEALESGAASYVPKARQAERLVDTIERVLHRAAADRRRGRLDDCILEYRWRVALENDPALIRELAEQVQQKMSNVKFADTSERLRVCEALEEALLNAMYHGNLDISEQELAEARADFAGGQLQELIDARRRQPHCQDRKILTIINITATEVRFTIRDEGKGFHVRSLVSGDMTRSFEDGKRRGLTLIKLLMDEVAFNDSGNELTMAKRDRAAAHCA